MSKLHAIDPAKLGRELAAERLAECKVPVEFAGLDGQQLPFEDNSMDAVLSTWTLCTIPDVALALREVRRVLKPGGQLFFLEHGQHENAQVVRWQQRIEVVWKHIGGGCHLSRPITDLVGESGLEITSVRNFEMNAPKPFGYMYEGVARA